MTQQSGALRAEVIDSEQVDEQLIEAERRVPDVSRYAGGVSSDSQHAALRASVRQLGQLLGEALTRHEGPELLALVESVRGSSREHRRRRAARRARPASTTPRRSCSPARSPPTSSWSTSPSSCTAGRRSPTVEEGPLDGHRPPDRRGVGQGHRRPASWSATCSADWSTGRSSRPTRPRRAVARCWSCCARSPTSWPPWRTRAGSPSRDRRSTNDGWPSWSTCCGRPTSCGSCDPSRRTRPGRRSTTCSRSPPRWCPDLLEELDRPLASIDVELPARRRGRCGSAPGPAATATATRTSPRAVTLDVLGLQHDFGLRDADRRGGGPAHRDDRLDPGRRGHRRAADQPRRATPRPCRSRTRRSVGSTPRSRTGSSSRYVRVRLQRTRDRLADGTPHEPGRDYLGLDELLADLTLVRDSMLADGDQLTADGAILRLIRTAAGDRPRPGHARRPRAQRASTTPRSPCSFDRLGELEHAVRRPRPRRRGSPCCLTEMASRRPLVGADRRRPGRRGRRRSLELLRRDPDGAGHVRAAT